MVSSKLRERHEHSRWYLGIFKLVHVLLYNIFVRYLLMKIIGPKQFFFSVEKVNNIFIPIYCDIIPK